MDLKTLNPIPGVKTWLHNATAAENTSQVLAPATNQQTAVLPDTPRDAEIVSGTFVPDIQINTTSHNDALAHTERLRKTVESFNDDRMVGLEWVIVHFFKALAYLLPPFIAWIVGSAIGQAFAGKFDWNNPYTWYSYGISIGMEMMIPVMGYSVTVAAKRATKDRSQIWIPIVLALFFVGLAVGNSSLRCS